MERDEHAGMSDEERRESQRREDERREEIPDSAKPFLGWIVPEQRRNEEEARRKAEERRTQSESEQK